MSEIGITQADIDAAYGQAFRSYQTTHDYEMDLRKAFARHRIDFGVCEGDDCWQCGGEGVVFDCIDDQCLDAEIGCDLCTKRCDVCS